MAENTEVENSYYKGANFEMLFAEFMKSDLGWENYVIRSQQKGKRNSKGSQVDIIGKRQDNRGKKLKVLGIFYLLLMIVLIWIGISNKNDMLIYMGVLLEIAGIIAIIISINFYRENAWVECKNRKTKSTLDDVRKSIEEYKDYKTSGDKEHKFVVHYFVSANGFVENALKHAKDNNLICYEYQNEKFIEVQYWK